MVPIDKQQLKSMFEYKLSLQKKIKTIIFGSVILLAIISISILFSQNATHSKASQNAPVATFGFNTNSLSFFNTEEEQTVTVTVDLSITEQIIAGRTKLVYDPRMISIVRFDDTNTCTSLDTRVIPDGIPTTSPLIIAKISSGLPILTQHLCLIEIVIKAKSALEGGTTFIGLASAHDQEVAGLQHTYATEIGMNNQIQVSYQTSSPLHPQSIRLNPLFLQQLSQQWLRPLHP